MSIAEHNATASGTGWAVVLGASEGTGAAIARAVAHSPGYDVFGVHRGHHLDAAATLAADIAAAGRRLHLRTADAATPEGAAAGADELATVAGPRGVRLF